LNSVHVFSPQKEIPSLLPGSQKLVS
jgi:hypothetical protein